MKRSNCLILFVVILTFSCTNKKHDIADSASGTDSPTPEYAAEVPDYTLTPDLVSTELLGNLEFFDGLPKKETVSKIYDFLDVSRGVHCFLNGIPAASVYALLEGFKEIGMTPETFRLAAIYRFSEI
jgi:hypothetical protein